MSTPGVPLPDIALWRTGTAARRAWLAARILQVPGGAEGPPAPLATRCVGESTQVAGYRLSLPSCGAVREEARGFHAAYRVSALL